MAHARDWPGVHCVREILTGEPIRGLWFDRSQEFAARNRGEEFGRLQYATEETFKLTPLPCWVHLPPEVYRQRIAELMGEIESEAAAELAAAGREPLGAEAVLKLDPETRPARRKVPAPLFHAATALLRPPSASLPRAGSDTYSDSRPKKSKKSPAPLFHAATKAMRKALWEAYSQFLAAFREAAERLRSGDRTARFPAGSFPPGLPFVREDLPGPP